MASPGWAVGRRSLSRILDALGCWTHGPPTPGACAACAPATDSILSRAWAYLPLTRRYPFCPLPPRAFPRSSAPQQKRQSTDGLEKDGGAKKQAETNEKTEAELKFAAIFADGEEDEDEDEDEDGFNDEDIEMDDDDSEDGQGDAETDKKLED